MNYTDFDKMLFNFNFLDFALIKEEYQSSNSIINSLIFENNIIILDDFEDNGEQYFIICADFQVISISSNLLYFLREKFGSYNCIIKTFSDEIKKKFYQNINKSDDKSLKKYHDLKCSISTDEIKNKKIEINSFMKKTKPKNHPILNQWGKYKRIISTFLIFIALQFNQDWRNLNYKFFFKSINEIKLDDDDYIDLKLLGKGSSSTVKLIFVIKSGYLLALKYLNKNDESFKLFNREKSNYQKLQHPFLLKYYGEIESIFYNGLILEYIEGDSLKNIKKLSIQISEKIKIIFQILVVFEFIHYNKYIYRDLKPNNIILNKNKMPILIDLGRLIEFNDDKKIENITVDFFSDYVPPEINQIDKISFKYDIYSIGLLIIFILFEEDPEIIIDYEKFDVIIKNQKLFETLPENLIKIKEICKNCLNYDPQKRPNISQLVNDFYFILFSKIPTRLTEKEEIISYEQKQSKKIFEYWFLCSETKNSHYLLELALFFNENEFIPDRINKMIYYLKKSAEMNNNKSQLYLGMLYLYHKNVVNQNINKAIHYLILSANQNNSDAQYYIGVIFYEGRFVQKNVNKGIYYLELSANQKNLKALYYLGCIYLESEYVQKDIKKGLEYIFFAASCNDASSLNALGVIYYNGAYVQHDINKSIYYHTLAAQQNYAQSQFDLGLIYIEDIYFPRDVKKAIKFFELASREIKSDSYYYLGDIYYMYDEAPRNVNKAIEYLTFSANENNDKAQLKLGVIYYENTYMKKDLKKAIRYFTLSANNNNSEAQAFLGLIYLTDEYAIRNTEKAIYYFNLSANNGFPYSQWCLGYIYENGLYTKKDISKAIYYYTLSANENISLAQTSLGMLYYYGVDVKKDIKLAIHFLTLGANNNQPIAQNCLGVIYYDGKYIEKDINKAIYYLQMSSNQGYTDSKYNLGVIYYYLNKIEKSIYYLKQAAKNDDITSFYKLGCIYFENKFISQNIDEVIHYYKEASSFNCHFSKNNLGVIFTIGLKINKSIQYAEELFKEAIKKSNDEASMYNLAHLYFYEEKNCFNFDECLDLLLKSANILFNDSIDLICLVFVNQYKNITVEMIEKELIKHSNNIDPIEIYKCIKEKQFDFLFEYHYQSIKNICFIYNFSKELIKYSSIDSSDFQNNDYEIEKNTKKQISNITKDFYEGFGFDIIKFSAY